MKVVRGGLLIVAIALVAGVTACGGAAPRGTLKPTAPGVIATTTSGTSGTLPFTTQPSRADAKFLAHLAARCRAVASPRGRRAQPTTLSAQASSSDDESRLLMRLRGVTAKRPPGDLARLMRSYRGSLLRKIDADEFVARAARSGNAEGVAYWLSQRDSATRAMRDSTDLLGAPACLR